MKRKRKYIKETSFGKFKRYNIEQMDSMFRKRA